MESTEINNTLLALLLALKDSDISLSNTEQSDLYQAAEQLSANPKAWEILIAPRLLMTIQANAALNQRFQAAKSQLDNLGDRIPLNLLPSEAELELAAPKHKPQPTTRAIPQVSASDLRSNEITNMAIRVMTTSNPAETAKKLNGFEQFQQFLSQNLSQNQ
ncbi:MULTISPECIES: hypothetical protein [unclassified Tolypothrix]|uniref:hypothetical protein n=1 Tax=unclassified Tolypothrix TaxID=2649714 RepID=UPI0005EAA2CE|nr:MULTISPECIES: hypothetical protein [unclassified Tolypothrix]BAY95794.1 hypothetical protein NIES3275_78710 [Microchaete diplosiphon NIES-3275]EKE98155.1 hypothetical protein FDUTEX481_04172 [Tolypothrix sp. PCC 7601]MBE9086851.1 hypothetical protein [Tolypothrix sp. LEGE 11397]UYD30819.1 hypothetical protein HGR01_38660 [Tolypothrix sp. PCC 7712]UYD38688.1 hypothetical protein HG267_40090 [Tolypothrix sp. PCC 7601]